MATALEQEVRRLAALGLHRRCVEGALSGVAALTLEINRLKKEKNAVVCAHVYQTPDIVLGVGDLTGDSYKLADDCRNTAADMIVFCGVHFMAETAKILNPAKKVYVPSATAGCSLSEAVTAADVRGLKARYPGLPVVTYINTSAEVKAESDCIVTSANAEKILRRMYEAHDRVIFIPDRFMGANLAKTLGKTPGEDIILWNGTCIVHERFSPELIKVYRAKYPGLAVLAHAECPAELIAAVDFMGGTGDMMRYVGSTNAAAYLLVTECGFGELAALKFPDKNFIAMCRLCPYMKSITLGSVLALLKDPAPQEVTVPPAIAALAKRSIEKMFELAAG
ncbi:MAG TPA: quinolinate synthase NadA [Elusimicrobiales bacterium]|mgnify:CR=1 FL=1|nr:quinolinate synthase NadA [Elusimicrobiales bacterium]